MKQAIIYTRFSPRRNADESESCEMQEASCRKVASDQQYDVLAVFHDKDVSGKDEYREKLWQAIGRLPKGGVLLVFKRDRLARNVYLAEQINRAVGSRGATIEAVSGDVSGDGPEHVMIRQVLAAIAEYERKLIAVRTSWAMQQHQKNGKRMSRYAPYGWQIDPDDRTKLIPDENEQTIIKMIIQGNNEDGSGRAIADFMNRSGIAPRSGRWTSKAVKKIIERNK